MLKIGDDHVICDNDHDLLLLSWMMRHCSHEFHAVCLRRYCAVIDYAYDLASVLTLCAAWAVCLPCTAFEEWGLGWSPSICWIGDFGGAQRTLPYPKPCPSQTLSKKSMPIASVHGPWMNSMMRSTLSPSSYSESLVHSQNRVTSLDKRAFIHQTVPMLLHDFLNSNKSSFSSTSCRAMKINNYDKLSSGGS